MKEKKLISLINKNNLNFIFVGNFKLWIGRFNPDFVNEDKRLIIELFGDYWHRNTQERDKNRLETYSKYGYLTLVIWEHELNDSNMVLKRIKEFIGGINASS